MAKHPHNAKRPEPKAVVSALEKEDIDALYAALTVRQRRFAEEYVLDFNGSAAAIRAGYATNYADRQAHLLLKHKGVSRYIDELTRSKEAKIVSVDPDYIIQQVTAIIGNPGAKDSDRLRGLELLARHLGMFIERQEITGKDGGPLEIEQKKVDEDAQSFTNLLRSLRDRAEKEKENETSDSKVQ
jgi:phage terminase small subunit